MKTPRFNEPGVDFYERVYTNSFVPRHFEIICILRVTTDFHPQKDVDGNISLPFVFSV
jgi:hypothetical protein